MRVGALDDGMLPVNTAGSPGGGLQWPSHTCRWQLDGTRDADVVDAVVVAVGGNGWLLYLAWWCSLALQSSFSIRAAQ